MDFKVTVETLSISIIAWGIFYYIFKRYVDRKVEAHLKEVEAKVSYGKERNVIIFEKNFHVVQGLMSLVYEARNSTRSIVNLLESVDLNSTISEFKPKINRYNLSESFSKIEDYLVNNKSFLGEEIFDLVHPIKKLISLLEDLAKNQLERYINEKGDERLNFIHNESSKIFEDIDSIYEELTKKSYEFYKTK